MLGVPGLTPLSLSSSRPVSPGTGSRSPSPRVPQTSTPIVTPRLSTPRLVQPKDGDGSNLFADEGHVFAAGKWKPGGKIGAEDARAKCNSVDGLFHSESVIGMPGNNFGFVPQVPQVAATVFPTQKWGNYTLPSGLAHNGGNRVVIPGFQFNRSGVDLPKLNLAKASMSYARIETDATVTGGKTKTVYANLTPRPDTATLTPRQFGMSPRLLPFTPEKDLEKKLFQPLRPIKFDWTPSVTPRTFTVQAH
mmetsp:Transcript_2941/g.6725  ORF Transcript_2941/g.6725 Transcript_2941/m.6725 type:complete len:249 (-) Transcript_2941:643-1389(-)|eukprot:g16856.t1